MSETVQTVRELLRYDWTCPDCGLRLSQANQPLTEAAADVHAWSVHQVLRWGLSLPPAPPP